MFGPVESGPNAQIERAASKSQSYFVWKNSPKRFLEQSQFFKQNAFTHAFIMKTKGDNIKETGIWEEVGLLGVADFTF
jgi:hypothetical protein